GVSDEGPAGIEPGVWRWESGAPYAFSFWNEGEPNFFGTEIYGLLNWGPQGEWNNAGDGPHPAIIEVYAGCPPPDSPVLAADRPGDLGHAITVDWHAYTPPGGPASYRLSRASESCLFGTPAETLLAQTSSTSYLDTSVVDYQSQCYRIEPILNGIPVDSLYS